MDLVKNIFCVYTTNGTHHICGVNMLPQIGIIIEYAAFSQYNIIMFTK